MPLFALSGVEGRLFTPLGVAYIVSILASFVVSMTVTPVLSYYLLPQSGATHREGDGFVLHSLKQAVTHLIRLSMAMPGTLLILTWLAVVITTWQMSLLGKNCLPPFDEGSIQVNVACRPVRRSMLPTKSLSRSTGFFSRCKRQGQSGRRDIALRSADGTSRNGRTCIAGQLW